MKKKVISIVLATSLIIGAKAGIVQAEQSRENRIQEYRSYCIEVGEEYGIAPELLEAIVYCESNYNPNETSGCNAQGLCQIIPKYQKERMKRLGITSLYNPKDNIRCCADILMEFVDKYGEDLYLILGYYNKGEYSGYKEEYENGNYSRYAIKVTEKAAELAEEIYRE